MRYTKSRQFKSSACRDRVLGLFVKARGFKSFLRDESGQDLVEYALVAVLISLGATASMSSVATAISAAFVSLGIKVGTYTS